MFTLLKWNGKYDNAAKFIVKNNKTNKYTLFTPDHIKDVAWTDKDMSKLPEYKDWEDFCNEKIEYLENVIM